MLSILILMLGQYSYLIFKTIFLKLEPKSLTYFYVICVVLIIFQPKYYCVELFIFTLLNECPGMWTHDRGIVVYYSIWCVFD